MEKEELDALLADQAILPRVKLEALIMTNIGLRNISQVTIPAELPDAVVMGRTIDEQVKPQVMKLQEVTDRRAKAIAIQVIKKYMEKLFDEIVEGSDSYKSLYRWSDRLGLRSEQSMVRPTVHEIYFFKEGKTRRDLTKILNDRKRIRGKAQKKPDPNMDRIKFAYPEEFDSKWIIGMGKLLGYPDCCVKSYAEDRVNGVNVEARAAKQLANKMKKDEKVDVHAYPLCFFYPCEPDCEKATDLGKSWSERLRKTDKRLGSLYEETLKLNFNIVLHQPEIIDKHISQLKSI
jgi:hypothetical protein